MSLPTTFFIGRGGISGVELQSSIQFTNGNQAGRLGPTSTSLLSYSSRADLQSLNFGVTSTGIQYLDVPLAGNYTFNIKGASSVKQYHGNQHSPNYGKGADFSGTLTIDASDYGKILYIAVGQLPANHGGWTTSYNGQTSTNSESFVGGGGGTFLAIGTSMANSVPIIVAGGGGSIRNSYSYDSNRINAKTDFNAEGNAGGGYFEAGASNRGGQSGNGGDSYAQSDQGTSGGGFYSRGDQNFADASTWGGAPWYNQSANSFRNGADGAWANSVGNNNPQPSGGFGGGGAGGWGGSGAGGGYSGGGSGTNNNGYGYGGGGSNFYDQTRISGTPSVLANHTGAGELTLTYAG